MEQKVLRLKMKASLLIFLAALAVSQAFVVRAPTARTNLIIGYVGSGDRLLLGQYVYQPAIPNTIQYQDVVFRGNFSTRITCIQATEVGYTQYATPWVIGGGLGYSNVTIRIQSYRGYGYYYLVNIWGR